AIMTRRGAVAPGIEVMQGAIAAAEALGSRLFRPAQLATLAGAQARLGDCACAVDLVEQAIEIAQQTGERQALAAIERVKGELLFALDRPGEGEAALRAASQTARTQGAISEQRRIEASLARLLSKASAPPSHAHVPAAAPVRSWLGALRALFGM